MKVAIDNLERDAKVEMSAMEKAPKSGDSSDHDNWNERRPEPKCLWVKYRSLPERICMSSSKLKKRLKERDH